MKIKSIFEGSRNYLMVLVIIWWAVLWSFLDKNANIFTALIVDQWKIILPAFSIMTVLVFFSLRFRMRIMVIFFIFTFTLVMLKILFWGSIFLVISIENKTPVNLYGVSIDFSSNNIRTTLVQPADKKNLVLKKALCLEEAKKEGYYIFIYDDQKKIYFQRTLNAEQLDERINTITVLENGKIWINNRAIDDTK